MAFLDETGLAHFWNQILARLNKFVPAEAGKGLSSNDYTTEEKEKLAGIETGANKTTVDSALSSTSTNPVQNSIINAKFDEIEASVAGKVDAVDGKGLSTNDLTSTLKLNYDTAYTHSQQAHAPSDAEKNVIIGVQKNGVDLTVNSSTRKINITVPTKTSDLTNDSNFATITDVNNAKITVDSALSSTSGNPVQNKVINSKFDEIKASIDSKVPSTRTVNGKNLSSNITLNASDVGALPDTTVIPSIEGLATETYVDNKVSGLINSAPETLDTLNELATALGNDPNFATTIATQIGGKVDKINGKGLSTNDYTTAEKNKLASIDESAEVNQNAFSNVIIGTTTIAADNKTDSLTFVAGDNVTLTPDATNDKITISATDTTYGEAGTNFGLVKSGGDVTISSGIITVNDDSHNHIISNIDGLQDQLDNKVDSITGKGLSTNDYTTKEKTKLSGIETGADVSTIKSISKNGTALSIDSSKNVNIEVPTKVSQLSNDSGYLTEHQDISGKADKATTLSGYGITDAYTQTQVDDKLSVKANKATTLAGYGITDAKISGGTITLGSNSITPVTDISGKQDVITGAATTIASSNLIANRALISNGSGKVAVSDVTSTQLGYLNSVTSNVQSQLNTKAPLNSPALTGTPTAPTADASVNNTQIATTAYVTTAINNVLNASNAMVFKGTIGTGGSVTSLPASHQVGDVYVVRTAGSYAGQTCEIGDMVVCTTTGTASKDSDWTVVQSNINGAVTGPSSSVDSHVAIFDGSTGKVVKDSGFTIGTSVPSNAVFTDTVYTHPSYTAKTGVPTANQTPSFGGKFTVTQPVSDATGHIVEMNSRTVTIPKTTASASANGLMTSADKIKLDTIAEGAEANQNTFSKVTVGSTTIEADSKTDTLTLIAGSNVTLTPDVTNDKITIASKDTIYTHPSYTATESKSTQTATHNGTITMIDNVTVNGTGHITGYNLKTVTLPADSDTHYESKNVVGATNATSNTSTALTNGNVYLNSVENGSVTSSHKISGSGATTVTTDTSGNIIISSTDNDTVYTHPSYTARTGVPTANQTPAFGGSFNISQPVSDSKGHITAINTRTVTIPNSVASTSAAGLMSSGDKTKLNGISSGANKTIVDSALSSTSTNPVQNKVINTKLDSMQSDIDSKVPSTRTVNGKALSSNITLSASDVGASTSSHSHAGMSINPSSIELNPGTSASYGGYIDFHYQGSSNDYTSRIIEDASGKLSITASNGVYIGGNKVYHAGNQQVIVSNTQPTTQVAGDLWYKVV